MIYHVFKFCRVFISCRYSMFQGLPFINTNVKVCFSLSVYHQKFVIFAYCLKFWQNIEDKFCGIMFLNNWSNFVGLLVLPCSKQNKKPYVLENKFNLYCQILLQIFCTTHYNQHTLCLSQLFKFSILYKGGESGGVLSEFSAW